MADNKLSIPALSIIAKNMPIAKSINYWCFINKQAIIVSDF
jgi:hypothetical protein